MQVAHLHPLEGIFGQVSGNSIISIDSETIPVLTGGKKNPFQGRARKIVIGSNVMVFQNKTINAYDAMVKRRLQKEGKDPDNFQLSPRTWGERVPNSPFVVHNGEQYLEVIFLRPGRTVYEVDGIVTEPQFIDGLSLDRHEAEQGGLDNKVVIRTYKFSSVLAVKIDGVLHVMRNARIAM